MSRDEEEEMMRVVLRTLVRRVSELEAQLRAVQVERQALSDALEYEQRHALALALARKRRGPK